MGFLMDSESESDTPPCTKARLQELLTDMFIRPWMPS